MNRKRVAIILIILSLILIIGAIAIYYLFSFPKVVSSEPVDNSLNVFPPETISVTTDRSAKRSIGSIEVKSETPVIYGSSASLSELNKSKTIQGSILYKGKTAYFEVSKNNLLVPQTSYEVKVTIKNGLNQKRNISLNFVTGTTASESNQQPVFNYTDSFEEGRIQGYEIVKYLPHTDTNFYMFYDYNKDQNKVTYTVYLKGDTTTAKNNAINWIKSKGSDPDKMNISYQVHDF